jgi:hypothetical protein
MPRLDESAVFEEDNDEGVGVTGLQGMVVVCFQASSAFSTVCARPWPMAMRTFIAPPPPNETA